ncbi:hypothetical protein [Fictibacillus phosphorivorans]|nr:hypothetical protein [Fictibacillus phosphorivorans]
MNLIVKLIGSKKEDSGCCKIEIKEIDAECCQNDSEEEKCCEK